MKALESLGYVEQKDYKEFIYFNLFKGKHYRAKKLLTLIAVLALSLGFIIYSFFGGGKTFLIAGGVVLIGTVMMIYNVNSNVKNHCKRQAKVVRAKQSNKFGKNGFVYDLLLDDPSENEHQDIFYDELDAVYVAKNAIYLYIEKRSTVIIPKRNLNISVEEAEAFLKKYIPAQKLVICA